MGLKSWFLGFFNQSAKQKRRPKVRGAYDAAQDTDENANHWAWTDSLNANAAANVLVRTDLREKARYEVANNAYAAGLVEKLGNDLVGSCPRLQLTIPGADRQAARQIERAFGQWSRAIGFGQKLRLLDNAAVRDGEGFGLLITNPAIKAAVQLDLKLYEADQVTTPFLLWTNIHNFDGGLLDDYGNVVEWHFLKVHPGSDVWVRNFLEIEHIPVAQVIHWFKPRRAGQLRGVPEITSSLSLYAYLRRYTLATIGAAELAANMAGILQSDQAPPGSTLQNPSIEEMDEVPIPRGALLTLPAGWTASQLKPEQPVSTYREFKGEILTEAGQAVQAPRNVATGSSAEYNYSSGRLDYGIYYRGIKVRRSDLRDRVLDPIFRAWLDEALLIPGIVPDALPSPATWTWDWFFDGFLSLDPKKDAEADNMRLANGTTTYAEIFAEDGRDWEEQFEQQAREAAKRAELGLPATTPATAPVTQTVEVA